MNSQNYNEQLQKVSKARNKNITGVIAVIVIAVIVILVVKIIPDSNFKSQAKNATVTETYYLGSVSITYGELLENYCTKTSWSVVSGYLGKAVEFRGDSPRGEILVQISKSDDGTYFYINYMSIRGFSQQGWNIDDFISQAYRG